MLKIKVNFPALAAILLFAVSAFAQAPGKETATVRAFLEAFNSQDTDRMMSLVTADVRWFTVSGDRLRSETSGSEALKDFLAGYFKSCPTCRSKITGVSKLGARVSVAETASWSTPEGRKTNDSFAVYEFENGRIARVYYYAPPTASEYDGALARRVGADERGMKRFVFVNLVRGKKQFEKEERDRLIAGHMEFIGRVAAERKLVLAGPFFDNDDVRGIYVFDVDSIEKAREIVDGDPSIRAGVFEVQMRLWYGSAALVELDRIHKSLVKKP